MTTPLLVVHDVPEHGVATYARQLASAVGAHCVAAGPALDAVPPGTQLHLQFTDRLWASSPETAADEVVRLARSHPLTVTVHDLPQPSDGARNLPRRAAAYRAVATASRGIVCNSAHEALLLAEWTDAEANTTVIPLPVDAAPTPDARDRLAAAERSVSVLGFFYPGKGHDEVLAAAVTASVTHLVILGRASTGHEGELAAFVAGAADAGVRVDVTGYLDDDELVRRCRDVGVPVIAHRHVSASGSLLSWLAAGRRPVVVANRYVSEQARLRPGTMIVVEPEHLAKVVTGCLDDPARTWLPPGTMLPFGIAEVAREYRAWWQTVSWR